jgi:uncharacterized protein YndB with AHSA1/START domain
MSTNTRRMKATPDQVWDVLADGWLYPLWVVGASRMRSVDAEWPQVGSRLHHSVGTWPLLIDDTTSVQECVPGHRIVLHARAWPTGAATVALEVQGVGEESDVTITEVAASGPPRLVPQRLLDLPLSWRNTETLRRLAYIVERRSAGRNLPE